MPEFSMDLVPGWNVREWLVLAPRHGQGWETDAICGLCSKVVYVLYKGGIGKISGVVVGVLIFSPYLFSYNPWYTNLQFVFSGIIILVAVTLDCLKYVQKK